MPQGSVLGPILFLVFVADITEVVESDMILFADDTKLYRKIESEEDSHILQRDIDNLYLWSKDWLMEFNKDKCKTIHYGHGNQCIRYNIDETRMVPELKHMKYEDRLKKLEIYHLSARRLRGDLIETYKLLNNFTDVPFERFFRKSSYLSTRCANSCKLEKPSFTKGLQCRVNFFSYRVINAWNKLPEYVISSKSVNAFKSNLDRYWCKIRYGFSQA